MRWEHGLPFFLSLFETTYLCQSRAFRFSTHSQSTIGSEEGAHQASHERVHGLGAGSTPRNVKTISTSAELGAEQVTGQAMEVSVRGQRISLRILS